MAVGAGAETLTVGVATETAELGVWSCVVGVDTVCATEVAEFVVFFFKTLLQQDVKKRRGYGSSSDSRYDDGRGPPGNPPRRMGRISHLRGPSPPPMAGG